MGLESGTYLSDLVASNPAGTDLESQGDDHIRLIKSILQATFPTASKAFRFPDTKTTQTTNYSLSITDDFNKAIPMEATSGVLTVTLPDAASTPDGWFCFIFKSEASTNAVVLDPSGATLINGASTFSITKAYQAVIVRNIGSAYWIAHQSFPVTPYYAGAQDIPFSDIAPSGNAKRILGAATATDFSEQTIADVLEWIGTCARGDILLRGASAFDRKALGTSGAFLKSDGTDLVYGLPLVPAYTAGTYTASTALTTIIPYDNTIPQIGEGTEIISISITPIKSTSVIRVTFTGQYSTNSANHGIAALFKDGAASAVQAVAGPTASSAEAQFALEYSFSPGSTSAITLAIRVGAGGANIYMNGLPAGRNLGGASAATLIAQEIFTA